VADLRRSRGSLVTKTAPLPPTVFWKRPAWKDRRQFSSQPASSSLRAWVGGRGVLSPVHLFPMRRLLEALFGGHDSYIGGQGGVSLPDSVAARCAGVPHGVWAVRL
jgi:hypothetical protein